jgi:hypothetical protein
MTPITPIGCLRDVVDLPPSAFALPGDGRQRNHLCRQRKVLAVVVARYANGDGSGAYPAAQTVGKATGYHRSTVFRPLKDLQELVTDGRLECYRGGRDRTLRVARMQAVASSPVSESHLRDSGVASSRAEVAKEDATQPPLGPPFCLHSWLMPPASDQWDLPWQILNPAECAAIRTSRPAWWTGEGPV